MKGQTIAHRNNSQSCLKSSERGQFDVSTLKRKQGLGSEGVIGESGFRKVFVAAPQRGYSNI